MMANKKRSLALLVHCRDVVSTRHAVQQAIRSDELDIVQLRATESDSDDDVVTAGKILADLIHQRHLEEPHKSRAQLIVNHGSLDIVTKGGACGWHLKEQLLMKTRLEDLEHDLRDAHRRDLTVGCSVHSVEAAIFAAKRAIDYMQVGTMFTTLSHPEKSQTEGPQLVQQIRRSMAASDLVCPRLIAVGGINTKSHVSQVLMAGADGVAVIRGILGNPNPDIAARSYRAWLDEWAPDR